MDDERSAPTRRILVGMRAIDEAFQIGVLVLISISVVMSVLLVWRDDHRWVDRRQF